MRIIRINTPLVGSEAKVWTLVNSEPEFIAWENAEGKEITAAVKEVTEDKVHFLLSNGKTVWYPIAKLSAESQERLKKAE